jgi:GNAT superfamily N-acetyltransferase
MASLGLWRLTRNAYGRRVYAALKRAGVTATRMYEYVASTADPPPASPPPGVRLGTRRPADLEPSTRADFADPEPGDTVLVAEAGGEVVGYLFLSDRPVTVDALGAEYTFDGVYVWRVFVAPSHRERGVASALVARALDRARAAGRGTAHAMVALDNRPSQWLFEGAGFDRRRRHTYLKIGRWERRAETRLG